METHKKIPPYLSKWDNCPRAARRDLRLKRAIDRPLARTANLNMAFYQEKDGITSRNISFLTTKAQISLWTSAVWSESLLSSEGFYIDKMAIHGANTGHSGRTFFLLLLLFIELKGRLFIKVRICTLIGAALMQWASNYLEKRNPPCKSTYVARFVT